MTRAQPYCLMCGHVVLPSCAAVPHCGHCMRPYRSSIRFTPLCCRQQIHVCCATSLQWQAPRNGRPMRGPSHISARLHVAVMSVRHRFNPLSHQFWRRCGSTHHTRHAPATSVISGYCCMRVLEAGHSPELSTSAALNAMPAAMHMYPDAAQIPGCSPDTWMQVSAACARQRVTMIAVWPHQSECQTEYL